MASVVSETKAFGCVGNTIRLRSGRYFDLAAPHPDQFTFNDIAGALSKICRFGAQTDKFYSVAEHCVHCSQAARLDDAPLAVQAAVLMHDAAEAFCGDVVKPLKIMLPDYAVIEKRIEAAIASKFSLDFSGPRGYIRSVDQAALLVERNVLFERDGVPWAGEMDVRMVTFAVWCWGTREAEDMFRAEAARCGLDIDR